MDKFPKEVISIIFENTDLLSFHKISQTCKLFKSSVDYVCNNTLISIAVTVVNPGIIPSRWIILCDEPIGPGGGTHPRKIPITHSYYLMTINTFKGLIQRDINGNFVNWAGVLANDHQGKYYKWNDYVFPNLQVKIGKFDYRIGKRQLNYRTENVNYPPFRVDNSINNTGKADKINLFIDRETQGLLAQKVVFSAGNYCLNYNLNETIIMNNIERARALAEEHVSDKIILIDRVALMTNGCIEPVNNLRCSLCRGQACHYPSKKELGFLNAYSLICGKCITKCIIR